MRNFNVLIIVLGFSFALSGCKKDESKAEPIQESPQANAAQEAPPAEPSSKEILASLDPRVQKASDLAQKIEKDPENSDQVLAQNDMDREKLDALMYEIARNPQLTEQYRIARVME